jgi:hypothetical protein
MTCAIWLVLLSFCLLCQLCYDMDLPGDLYIQDYCHLGSEAVWSCRQAYLLQYRGRLRRNVASKCWYLHVTYQKTVLLMLTAERTSHIM